VRTRRVADRETRHPETPILAQAVHRGRRGDGQILASELTSSDVDNGSQVGPLLEQIPRPLHPSSVMGPTIRWVSTPPPPNVILMLR
jgi:hypothetical protein